MTEPWPQQLPEVFGCLKGEEQVCLSGFLGVGRRGNPLRGQRDTWVRTYLGPGFGACSLAVLALRFSGAALGMSGSPTGTSGCTPPTERRWGWFCRQESVVPRRA